MTEGYVELHAASAFSFLEGASEPEKLIERAVELEMPGMALLDRNGVYGSARFHTSAKRNGISAHVGAEVAVSSFGPRSDTSRMAAAPPYPGACSSAVALRVTDRLSEPLPAHHSIQDAGAGEGRGLRYMGGSAAILFGVDLPDGRR
jgi:hypothetical protein